MKNKHRELFLPSVALIILLIYSGFGYAQVDQDIGRFDYRTKGENPEATRLEKQQFYDLIVEEYEAVRVARLKLENALKVAEGKEKEKILKKLEALKKKEEAIDKKMENPPQ